jgi:hypothetical protein
MKNAFAITTFILASIMVSSCSVTGVVPKPSVVVVDYTQAADAYLEKFNYDEFNVIYLRKYIIPSALSVIKTRCKPSAKLEEIKDQLSILAFSNEKSNLIDYFIKELPETDFVKRSTILFVSTALEAAENTELKDLLDAMPRNFSSGDMFYSWMGRALIAPIINDTRKDEIALLFVQKTQVCESSN